MWQDYDTWKINDSDMKSKLGYGITTNASDFRGITSLNQKDMVSKVQSVTKKVSAYSTTITSMLRLSRRIKTRTTANLRCYALSSSFFRWCL